jgi:hypothetical protein
MIQEGRVQYQQDQQITAILQFLKRKYKIVFISRIFHFLSPQGLKDRSSNEVLLKRVLIKQFVLSPQHYKKVQVSRLEEPLLKQRALKAKRSSRSAEPLR